MRIKSQRGLSLLGVLVVGALAAFVLIIGFRTVPVVTEYMAVKRIIGILADEADNERQQRLVATLRAEIRGVDTALTVPSIDPETWRLVIDGMVDQRVEMSLHGVSTFGDISTIVKNRRYFTSNLAVGAELLVSDLDPGRVRLAMEQFDAKPVTNDALISTPCDIVAPCGVGPVLNGQSVMQLRCAAVAGAANNQLTTLQVADQLESRGILYAPDYVINAGGLIYVALTHRGEDLGTITAHLARIPTRLTEVFAHAQAEKRSPARVADELAERLLYK